MDRVKELIALLERATADPLQLAAVVEEFQSAVFAAASHDLNASPQVEDTLRTLAYDLDFYVPDPEARAEDSAHYGDERAVREIRQALDSLRTLGVA